ncbi:MAG: hypothetical protein P8P99_11240 [Maricaulis sp.]|nr:hypothetical protein [Maricaulis sp.]
MEPIKKYAVGQAWSIKNIDEPNARIVIGRIESAANLDGKIVMHCTIFDAVIADTSNGPEPLIFGHIPFTEEAFAAPVDTLLDSKASTAEAFDQGYYQWAEAMGGAFSGTIAATLDDAMQAAATSGQSLD